LIFGVRYIIIFPDFLSIPELPSFFTDENDEKNQKENNNGKGEYLYHGNEMAEYGF
jgi:hypothetical protein